jgi:hypothetical protein
MSLERGEDMNIRDEVAIANQRLWEEEAKKGCGYTIPWLELDVSLLRQYADGKLEFLPEPMTCIYPFLVHESLSWIWPRANLRETGKRPCTMDTM